MKMIKVRDQVDDIDVYVNIQQVHTVGPPANDILWWDINTATELIDVNEADAMRVIAAFEDEDLSALSSSELQVEWERSEARMIRLGAELSRRAH